MPKSAPSDKPTSPRRRTPRQREASTRKALLVLGMHRSGTSALTRVLSLLGATLPNNLMGVAEGNEAGHWEPEKLVALHDSLLANAGSRWDDYRPLDLGPASPFVRDETLAKIKAQIVEDYGTSTLLVVKDPRISRFVPTYERALRELGAQPAVVLSIRNPLAVVRSLIARKALAIHSVHYASLVWLRHNLDAERFTRSMPRAVVSYESLLRDWRGSIAGVDAALNLELPLVDTDLTHQIDSFLSNDLQHQKESDETLESAADIPSFVKQAYAALLRLETHPADSEAQTLLDAIAAQFNAADAAVGSAVHDELRHWQQQLEAALNTASHASHDHYVRTLDLQKDKDELANELANVGADQIESQRRAIEYSGQLLDARERVLELLEQTALRVSEIDQLRLRVGSADEERGRLLKTLAELQDDLLVAKTTVTTSAGLLEENQRLLAATADELDFVRRELEASRREAAAATPPVLREFEAESLTGPISTLETEQANAQRLALQAAALRGQLDALLQSTSWRVTTPLRAMARQFPQLTRSAARATRISGYVWKGHFWEKFTEWRAARRSARLQGTRSHEKRASSTPLPASAAAFARSSASTVRPLVSVIVLNYNKPELTIRSVQHVIDNTPSVPVEIIVVDNGSTPENFVLLIEHLSPAARLIRLDVNRYFGEGNNIGAENADGRYVVFLNNDAFVKENWLPPMLEVFEKFPHVGGVGPKFIYPDGRLQEVGGTVHADGTVTQHGKSGIPDPAILTNVREVDYSSAACFLMTRDRFLEVGGFDLVYEPAYYEDVDLCLKLRASGLKVYCTPLSTVIHLENATSGDESNRSLQLNTIVEHNRKKFTARWSKWLETPGTPVWKAQPRQVLRFDRGHRRSIGIYTPYNLVPGGGERYLLHAAQVLSNQGDVTIVTEHPYSSIRVREMLRDFGIAPFPFRMAVRRDLEQPFDLAIVMGNEAIPAFSSLGNRNVYVCQFPFPMSEQGVFERRRNLEGYETIIVYSGFVRDCLISQLGRNGIPCPPVEVIWPAVGGLSVAGKTLPASGPIKIISIGRFFVGGHNKRQDAIIDAVIQLTRRNIRVELSLVGSVHPEPEHRQRFRELVAMADGYPISFYPDAAPETVSELLAASHIYCHAAGLGADDEPHRSEHFGISVVEGMRAGSVPFVVANGGPASIVADGATGYHYRTIPELIERVASLIDDPRRFEAISSAAHRAALEFDDASFARKWTFAGDRQMLRKAV